jgi:sugar phosphate isomerase/epimerase
MFRFSGSSIRHLAVASGLVVAVAMGACSSGEAAQEAEPIASIQLEIPDAYRIGGFAVGPQAYTFNRFTVMEAIENAARMGGRTIELYPGQRLSPVQPEVRFDANASDEAIAQVRAKLQTHDILPVNFGVVGLPNDEQQLRRVFDFARKLGVPVITSEPSMEAMDLIETMVQEYDIMVAIHNHPPRPDRPEYRVWDPSYVLSMVQGRDPRLGASADIGHWIRSEIRPVDGLRILEGRLISLHITDVDRFGREGRDVVMGTGVGELAAVLDELKRQNFGGHLSIEYEANWDDNVPDASQNVGFIRGWAAARGH